MIPTAHQEEVSASDRLRFMRSPNELSERDSIDETQCDPHVKMASIHQEERNKTTIST